MREPMRFYLGTHKPTWLKRTDVPLFVSARRLRECVRLPRAIGPWALDSGGFTEIGKHGKWVTSPAQYVEETRRWATGIGGLEWAAIQDWMCEPAMLAKTGLSVERHQRLTVESYLRLGELAYDLPWMPVIQGWTLDDYLACVRMYEDAGVCLPVEPVVGLGSVCRRQATDEAEDIVRELSSMGLSLHLFGFKLQGLARVGHLAASSDSLAWSYDARRAPPMNGHTHKSCSNCMIYALRWREKVERILDRPAQEVLF